MKTLKKPMFIVNVFTNNGGGYFSERHSVNACIVEGLNHARFLLNNGTPGRMTCKVRVAVVCKTCNGDGTLPSTLRRGPKRCPDCDGGKVTSPISGPTAIELTVAKGGAVYENDGPVAALCQDGLHEREGEPGEVCRKCGRAIPQAAVVEQLPYVVLDPAPNYANKTLVERLDARAGDGIEVACFNDDTSL